MVTWSSDGGETWSKPVEAATIFQEMEYRSPARFRAWSSMFPSIDVGPDGTVYIVYASASKNPADPGDVYLVYSTDGGATWSEPVRVNDDAPGAYQFFPWLDVDESGVVHIVWGDTRFDRDDNFGYDIFYARFDLESGLSPNFRVSDFTSNGFLGGFIGDYFNVAAAGGEVYVVWTDLREAVQEKGGFIFIFADSSIYFAKLGERPQPSLSISVDSLHAGRGVVASIRGENLPINSPFLVAIDGSVVSEDFVFTDEEGRLEASILLPPLAEGEYTVMIVDMTVRMPYASATLRVVDAVAASAEEASRASQEAVERVEAVAEKLGRLEESLQESVALVSERLDRVEKAVREEGEATRGEVASAAEEVKGEVRRVGEEVKDEVRAEGEKQRGAIEELASRIESRMGALESAIASLAERLSAVEGALAGVAETAEEAASGAAAATQRSSLAVGAAILAFLAAAAAAYLSFRR
jgi:prefoldin subunit 5